MTGLVWFAILAGLAIVILAVGIPYLRTHKGMHDPYDTSEGRDYLRAKRRWRHRSTQPANPGGREDTSESPPDRP